MKNIKLLQLSARALVALALASTAAMAALQVNFRDEGGSDALWAKPRIFITNTGTNTSTIASVRYYFDKVPGKTPALEVWDAGGAPGYIVDAGAQYYAEINLGGTQLAAGQSLRWGNGILFGLHNTDWSAWNKTGAISITVQSSDQIIPPPNPPNNDQVINSIGSDCWENYAVLAKNSLQLLDRSLINGTVGSATAIQLGADSDVNQGSIFSNGTITLQDRTYVGGDVRSTTNIIQGVQVQVTGAVNPYSTNVPTCAINAPQGTATGGTVNITVAQGTTYTLVPGTYKNVEVGYNATLILSEGQYVFNSLTVREDAGIRLTAGNLPVKVLSVNPFIFKDRSRVTMDGQEAARRLQLTSVSTGVSLIAYDARLKGTFAAPVGTIQLQARAAVTGGVVAASISGDYDAQVSWAPRLATINLPPTIMVNPLMVRTGTSAPINTSHIQVLDPDTQLNLIRITYKYPPMGGYLTKNGLTLSPGATLTVAEITTGQIAFVHTASSVVGDLVWFEATDGVNTVLFKLTVTITN